MAKKGMEGNVWGQGNGERDRVDHIDSNIGASDTGYADYLMKADAGPTARGGTRPNEHAPSGISETGEANGLTQEQRDVIAMLEKADPDEDIERPITRINEDKLAQIRAGAREMYVDPTKVTPKDPGERGVASLGMSREDKEKAGFIPKKKSFWDRLLGS
jgi:hypothetical protein